MIVAALLALRMWKAPVTVVSASYCSEESECSQFVVRQQAEFIAIALFRKIDTCATASLLVVERPLRPYGVVLLRKCSNSCGVFLTCHFGFDTSCLLSAVDDVWRDYFNGTHAVRSLRLKNAPNGPTWYYRLGNAVHKVQDTRRTLR